MYPSRTTLRTATTAMLLLVAFVIVGCSAGGSSDPTMSAGKLEQTASERLTEGLDTDVRVRCDKGITIQRGEVAYCVGVADGFGDLEQDVRVRVTSSSDSDDGGKFDIAILQKWPPEDIDDTVSRMLADQGAKGASLDGCDEPQTIEKGRTFTCGLRGVQGKSRVRVTFTNDDGDVAVDTLG